MTVTVPDQPGVHVIRDSAGNVVAVIINGPRGAVKGGISLATSALEWMASSRETRACMNRIEERFARLRRQSRKGLVAYIGAGDPDLERTRELGEAFDRAGVDVLELGVPFSDPLADGMVNQLAAQRGLASGTTPAGVLSTVRDLRRHSAIPVVLYLYYNLIHRFGEERFVAAAAAAGVDGLLVLDLPPEESGDFAGRARQAGLSLIRLVAPTTPEARLAEVVRGASGFVYYVSREGVTGMQPEIARDLAAKIAGIRRHTALPVAVGFGISNGDQARAVAAVADAVVVGSAIVDRIGRLGVGAGLVSEVTGFVRSLVEAVKES